MYSYGIKSISQAVLLFELFPYSASFKYVITFNDEQGFTEVSEVGLKRPQKGALVAQRVNKQHYSDML